MNYYKTGLQMQVRVLGNGRISIGGLSTVTEYKNLAVKLWGDVTDPYAVISITRDGATYLVSPYKVKDEASDHYGTVTDMPGSAVYVAYFDRAQGGLIDEAFFQSFETIREVDKTPPKKPPNMGLVFGIAAAGVAGMVMFKPKKKAVV